MAPPPAAIPLSDVDDEEADADHDEAWDAEFDRRIADAREGRVECIPVEAVFADIDAMLARVKREQLAAGR